MLSCLVITCAALLGTARAKTVQTARATRRSIARKRIALTYPTRHTLACNAGPCSVL